MGATGKGKAESYYDFKDNPDLSDLLHGDKYAATDWWMNNTELSNMKEWYENTTPKEDTAIENWVGADYHDFADLYDVPWDELPLYQKMAITNLYNAINKFELKKGITVNRATNFKIFGSDMHMTAEQVQKYLETQTQDGMIQADGFMSFSTVTNGVPVAGSGLIIHLDVPPSTGAGAYVPPIGGNHAEREFLLNNNSILKFDPKSVRKDSNGVHVNAKLVGRAEMQTIDEKNKSKFKKEQKPLF